MLRGSCQGTGTASLIMINANVPINLLDDAHFDRVLTGVVIAFVHGRLASGGAGGAARKIQQVAVAVLAEAQALIEAMRPLAPDVARQHQLVAVACHTGRHREAHHLLADPSALQFVRDHHVFDDARIARAV